MRLDTTRSQTTAENSGVPVTLLPLGGKDPPHEFELPLEHLCRDEGEPLTVLAHEDKPLAGGETEMVARRFRDDDLATLVHRDGTPHVLALGGRWQYAAVIELLGSQQAVDRGAVYLRESCALLDVGHGGAALPFRVGHPMVPVE
jgi:hypothetical protein